MGRIILNRYFEYERTIKEKGKPPRKKRVALLSTRKELLNLDYDKHFKDEMLNKKYWENLIKQRFIVEKEPFQRNCNLPRIFAVILIGVEKSVWGKKLLWLHRIRVKTKKVK